MKPKETKETNCQSCGDETTCKQAEIPVGEYYPTDDYETQWVCETCNPENYDGPRHSHDDY